MHRLVKIVVVLWSVVMVASALTHRETAQTKLFLCLTSLDPQNCDFLSKVYEKRDKVGSSLTRLCDKSKRTPFLTEAFFDLCSLPAQFKNSL